MVLKARLFFDFLAEMTPIPSEPVCIWMVFTNGSSNSLGNGVSVILENDSGMVVEVSSRFKFLTNNNQVEYEAVITIITLVEEMVVDGIKLQTDSHLVISEISREAQAKDSLL